VFISCHFFLPLGWINMNIHYLYSVLYIISPTLTWYRRDEFHYNSESEKIFENWSRFAEVMIKSHVSCIFETQCSTQSSNVILHKHRFPKHFNRGFGSRSPQALFIITSVAGALPAATPGARQPRHSSQLVNVAAEQSISRCARPTEWLSRRRHQRTLSTARRATTTAGGASLQVDGRRRRDRWRRALEAPQSPCCDAGCCYCWPFSPHPRSSTPTTSTVSRFAGHSNHTGGVVGRPTGGGRTLCQALCVTNLGNLLTSLTAYHQAASL